jgi:hypothetical protein
MSIQAWTRVVCVLAALASVAISFDRALAQSCLTARDQERINWLRNRVASLDAQLAEAQVEIASGKVQQAAAEAAAAHKAAPASEAAFQRMKTANENLRNAEGRPRRLARELANFKAELDRLSGKPVCPPGTSAPPSPKGGSTKSSNPGYRPDGALH